jgi:hypothetical protein
MKGKRSKPERIIPKLREAEVELSAILGQTVSREDGWHLYEVRSQDTLPAERHFPV